MRANCSLTVLNNRTSSESTSTGLADSFCITEEITASGLVTVFAGIIENPSVDLIGVNYDVELLSVDERSVTSIKEYDTIKL